MVLSRVTPARRDDPPVAGTVREGWPYVLGPALLGLALWRWRPIVGAGLLTVAAGIAAFFRDPVRRLDPDPDLLYAPADGTVIGVDTVDDPWFVGRPSHRVSIFLSLLDVHVNRSPVPGEIAAVRDLGSGFAPAMHFERSHGNRRREVGIATDARPGPGRAGCRSAGPPDRRLGRPRRPRPGRSEDRHDHVRLAHRPDRPARRRHAAGRDRAEGRRRAYADDALVGSRLKRPASRYHLEDRCP